MLHDIFSGGKASPCQPANQVVETKSPALFPPLLVLDPPLADGVEEGAVELAAAEPEGLILHVGAAQTEKGKARRRVRGPVYNMTAKT